MNRLLDEFETMQNVALGAEALAAFLASFDSPQSRTPGKPATIWHLATVLPMAFHRISRRAISKRRTASGLRSILGRDPENDIAQNEAIFDLSRRMQILLPRTLRSINCMLSWGLGAVSDGMFFGLKRYRPKTVPREAIEIIRAAEKLGVWASGIPAFEYFAILGVDFRQ